MIFPAPSRRWLYLIGLLLVLAHIVWIGSTWEGMGYVKDEGYYFSASKDNFGWYRFLVTSALEGKPLAAFDDTQIDRFWRNNSEHPPFCKTVQGFSHFLLHIKLDLLNFGNSHRASTLMFTSFMVFAMFLLTAEWLGLAYGIFAVVLLFAMPHVFNHMHLCTFDGPVTAMCFLIAFAFRKGMESVRWSYVTGVLLGVGLATKNNAYFMPVIFAVMYIASPYFRMLLRWLPSLPGLFWRQKRWTFPFTFVLVGLPIGGLLYRPMLNYALFFDILIINLVVAYHWLRPATKVPSFLAPILPSMVTAPFVFFLLWPWIWHHTWLRLGSYIARHTNPPAWETNYLGKIIVGPPPFDWHYPFVMSWYTLPAAFIVLMLSGMILLAASGRWGKLTARLAFLAKGKKLPTPAPLLGKAPVAEGRIPVVTSEWDQLFILINIIVPFLVIANPKTPIYGGTKHWMTAMPWVAIACAASLRWMVNAVARVFDLNQARKIIAGTALALLLVSPGFLGIAHNHPNTLSYYNEIMGGTIASPEVGMQRTFWAMSTREVLDYINDVVPPNGSVFFNETPWDSFNAYREDGYIRPDIRKANDDRSADYAVLENWKFFTDSIYQTRQRYGARYAEYWSHVDGLPLTEVYRNVRKLDRKPNPPLPQPPASEKAEDDMPDSPK